MPEADKVQKALSFSQNQLPKTGIQEPVKFHIGFTEPGIFSNYPF